uniref:Uncharacterized protein n=1 Tax=Setaria viridis TaxID=4556 RepID=A0A4U6W498_SETVI|nr:hypothetical protein SEVIR_1G039850v2 [Setaria viridis]
MAASDRRGGARRPRQRAEEAACRGCGGARGRRPAGPGATEARTARGGGGMRRRQHRHGLEEQPLDGLPHGLALRLVRRVRVVPRRLRVDPRRRGPAPAIGTGPSDERRWSQ